MTNILLKVELGRLVLSRITQGLEFCQHADELAEAESTGANLSLVHQKGHDLLTLDLKFSEHKRSQLRI